MPVDELLKTIELTPRQRATLADHGNVLMVDVVDFGKWKGLTIGRPEMHEDHLLWTTANSGMTRIEFPYGTPGTEVEVETWTPTRLFMGNILYGVHRITQHTLVVESVECERMSDWVQAHEAAVKMDREPLLGIAEKLDAYCFFTMLAAEGA